LPETLVRERKVPTCCWCESALKYIVQGASNPRRGIAMSIFANREDAGKRLGEHLRSLELQRPVLLAIPRGGIPVAVAAAPVLKDAEIGVVVARKLGAPGRPELGIGAVTASGSYYLDQELARAVGATGAYVRDELQRQQAEALRRESKFDGHRRPPVKGRDAVIVDDGVATGATAIAALRAIRAAGARRVVFAVPVGPADTIQRLRFEADEVICLYMPEFFAAVGYYYEDFRPVDSDEAVRMLSDTGVTSSAFAGG
jgi:putative phosphoribosyl transferase